MSAFAQLSKQIAGCLDSCGLDSFPKQLASLFKAIVAVDNVMIINYPKRRLPVLAYNDMPPNNRPSSAQQFIAGAFLLDPYYLQATKHQQFGFYHLSQIAPAGFIESSYFQSYYKDSGLQDECGYILSLADDGSKFLNISMGHFHKGQRFNEQELELLNDICPLIQSLVVKHWQVADQEPDSALDLRAQLELALDNFGKSILTERENQMVQMILQGYSSKAIAERFGISVETVKLHRKNAYAKLDLGTQGELFNLFINSLMHMQHYEGGDPLERYLSPRPAQ